MPSRAPDAAAQRCAQAAHVCERIEAAIDARAGTAPMMTLFTELEHACAALARGPAADDAHRAATAVGTWRAVWARLGRQTEFRHAVAREAHRWAEQFAALATEVTP